MRTLKKTPGRDFVIAVFADPQLSGVEWAENHPKRRLLESTVREVVGRAHPDLIMLCGDISYAGDMHAYECYASFFDSLGIFWTPVWGNHDNQNGPECVEAQVELCLKHPCCVYERGDPAMGNGNFVIAIEESGRIVEAVFVMDSHERKPFTEPDGSIRNAWSCLLPNQIDWYRREIKALQELGCRDSTMVLHIPIHAYRAAWAAAFDPHMDAAAVTVEESYTGSCWQEGYKDSFGVKYEIVSSYPGDDGVFDAIRELGSTKTVVCGHNHTNNFVIRHEGVSFVYSMKLGAGAEWTPVLNGGTILRITESGVSEIRQEYVTVDPAVLAELEQ